MLRRMGIQPVRTVLFVASGLPVKKLQLILTGGFVYVCSIHRSVWNNYTFYSDPAKGDDLKNNFHHVS